MKKELLVCVLLPCLVLSAESDFMLVASLISSWQVPLFRQK